MTENKLFKDYFDAGLAQQMAGQIRAVHPQFPSDKFVSQIVPQLDGLEMKARTVVFVQALRDHLPAGFANGWAVLDAALGAELTEEGGMFNDGWHYWPIAHFIEVYGLEDFDVGVHAMREITKRHTAEFAIRPFLIHHQEKMLEILHGWAEDDNAHVRRLVSEGTRPRLPWAGRLYQFIEDPSPTLALLEKLKDDPSEYVRRSVSNHLNDIAKDHPQLVVETCRRWWQDGSAERRWIVKRALRTLVKEGDPDALAVLGFGPPQIELQDFSLSPQIFQLGGKLNLAFTLCSTMDDEQNLVIDFVIHFVKANGKTSGKVFKLKTAVLSPNQSLTIQKSHPIRPITTRKYYPGTHWVKIQVNGQIVGERSFELVI
ncbi:DNA alkylation repair enzyme [hydrothermal vent metagenome]|uniref:DNA alkylation repair enzyme n=1 Tax=hydrothermal vent metagenome TaxID=652676 RepID=A0A3B0VJ07_9ZZZZ